MLFAIPDSDAPAKKDSASGSTLPDSDEKAVLDESDLEQTDVPKALQKVELDLDDAPFLEDDEEELEDDFEAPPLPDLDESASGEITAPSGGKKRMLLAAAAAILLLAVIIPIKIWLFPQEEKVIEEIKPAEETVAGAPPPEPDPIEISLPLEPFWVEKAGPNGKTRFIHCRFSVITANPATEREIKLKLMTVRDGVYYYLKNKDFSFLADTSNIEELKKDLLSVINKYLGTDQLEVLLIEEYLVQ